MWSVRYATSGSTHGQRTKLDRRKLPSSTLRRPCRPRHASTPEELRRLVDRQRRCPMISVPSFAFVALGCTAVPASDLTRANRLVTCFESLEDVAGGVGEVGIEGEALAVDLDGR